MVEWSCALQEDNLSCVSWKRARQEGGSEGKSSLVH